MKFKMIIAAIVLAFASGCCTCQERYDPALAQWQENLEALRPTLEKGAATLPAPELGKTKMDRYDRTIQGIKRVRGEGPEVFAGGAK